MMTTEPWKGYIEPFRIWGNLYFVGSVPASVHIVDTGDGLLMFDCGYQESLYLVLESMRKLKLDPTRLKAIFLTHGHIDHCGAACALRRLYGCKIYLGEPDLGCVNGTTGLSYDRELGLKLIPFEPDVMIHGEDRFTFGKTEVYCVATPGHTAGVMSYFFPVSDGERTYRAGLHGGMGINTLSRAYLEKYSLPDSLRVDFVESMKRLKREKVDIFLGNHADHNHTVQKSQQLLEGNKDAFINPGEWEPYAEWCIDNFRKMLEKENN